MPLPSAPVCTSTGVKRPASLASMTSWRVPVAMTASDGSSRTSAAAPGAKVSVVNIPGSSKAPGLASSMRAVTVRVAALTSGKITLTLPWNTLPGSACARASTAVPGRTLAAALSGSAALTQTLDRPLMRNRGAPAATVMPSRASNSAMTPAMGAATVSRACTLPLFSTRRICASSMPARRMRWRAASASPAAPSPRMRRAARNSSCAAIQSGTYSSARACPLRTGSKGARTARRSR